MTCNFLLLNSDKTEVLLIGPKNYPKNLLPYNFRRMSSYSNTVKDLGVSQTVLGCFYWLYNSTLCIPDCQTVH